ncbi:hypothetical protein ACFL6C_09570 [Myxococcota bacterium]
MACADLVVFTFAIAPTLREASMICGAIRAGLALGGGMTTVVGIAEWTAGITLIGARVAWFSRITTLRRAASRDTQQGEHTNESSVKKHALF